MRFTAMVMVAAAVGANAWSQTTGCGNTCAGNNSIRESAQHGESRVDVYLNSTTEVPPTLLDYGEQVSKDIFSKISVRLVWRSGNWHPAPKGDNGCAGESARREFLLEIVPRAPETAGKGALARATPYGDTRVRVVIFYDRVNAVLQRHRNGRLIFGYMLAHEIAHVLQGVARHSETGIMRAYWTEDDYMQMGMGRLAFAAKDIALIRQGLAPTLRCQADSNGK